MNLFKKIGFFSILITLIAGCAHNTITNDKEEKIEKRVETPKPKPNPKPPEWYTKSYKSDQKSFYAKGVGEDEKEAVADALEAIKEDMISSLSNVLMSGKRWQNLHVSGSDELTKSAIAAIERIEISKYRVLQTSRLPGKSEVAVLLAADRKEMAKGLKEELIKKLVPIEERWHNAKRASTLKRYIIAKESYRKMKKILPLYISADFISPFSKKIRDRVEPTLSYFRQRASKLRKKIGFCIKKSSSPAIELFTKAVERRLKKDGFKTYETIKGKDTICITLVSKLKHHRRSQSYIFSGTVRLVLHPPYSEPIRVEEYKVYGESKVSGKRALENAAQRLQKMLASRFLRSV